jgi:hypothetical protein
MPCGRASGIVALDLDVKSGEDGPGEFAKLVRDRGETLPRTRTVRTPSGGTHLLCTYSDPIPSSKGKLGPGIEVKGDGTYILVAPSPGYVIEDSAPPAPLPEWIAELAKEPKNPTPRPLRNDGAQTTLDLSGPPILEGGRHDAMLSMAGRLQDGTRTSEDLHRDLTSINEARCDPPLPMAEVTSMADWAGLREPCTSGRPPELTAMLDRLSEAWFRLERRGLGGKNEVRLVRVLLEAGSRVGTVVEDGLRISMSLRQIAEMLSCSLSTVVEVRNRMVAKGLVRIDRTDLGRKTATGIASAALVVIDTPATTPVHPTDCIPSMWIVRGVPTSSRPSSATLKTAHYRHRGPVGYSREDTLCWVESRPGSTREDLASFMGWSRSRDLEARHLRPLEDLGLIAEDGGRWTISDRYAEAQQDVKLTAFSTIQLRSARQWDPEAGRYVHFVTESGSVASQEKREEWDIERHRRQRELWKLTLAAKKAAAEEACQPGRVVIEDAGDLVDAETGEVVGDAVRSGWDPDETPDRTVAA